MLEHYLYLIARLYLIILFHNGAIDPDMSFFGCLLDFVPCGVLDKVHQEFIHPQRLLAFGGHKAMMLIEIILGKLVLIVRSIHA